MSENKVQRKRSHLPEFFIILILFAIVAFVIYIIVNASSKSKLEQKAAKLTNSFTTAQTSVLSSTTTTTTTLPIEKISTNLELPQSASIDVDVIYQKPELPTGCEVTSLTMVLNFYGFDVTKTEIVDKYLPTQPAGVCDFTDAFVGSPYNENDFGCFAPVIKKTAESFFTSIKSNMYAEDLTGSSLDDLYQYIAQGYPLVVWSTIGCYEPDWNYYWTLDDGTEVDFPTMEHCVVLTGYDTEKNTVYINDPLKGKVYYDRNVFEDIYIKMEKQAVLIYD